MTTGDPGDQKDRALAIATKDEKKMDEMMLTKEVDNSIWTSLVGLATNTLFAKKSERPRREEGERRRC